MSVGLGGGEGIDAQAIAWLRSRSSPIPLSCPKQADLVGLELAVGGEDPQVLQLSLCDEKAVEGVRMMMREAADVQRMAVLNGQRSGAARFHPREHILHWRQGKGKFPSAYLIAISQEFAADRKSWLSGSWSSSRTG